MNIKVLEIGTGGWPRPFKDYVIACDKESNYAPSGSPILEEFVDLTKVDRYVGIELNGDWLAEARLRISMLPMEMQQKISLLQADGRRLPFSDRTFDVVFFEDVFSAPTPGTTPVSVPYPRAICISEKTKRLIFKKALRLLKPGGIAVICICQTPCYSVGIFDWISNSLIETGAVRMIRMHGELSRGTDNWHLYHIALQKCGGTRLEETQHTPYTLDQKKYIDWVEYQDLISCF